MSDGTYYSLLGIPEYVAKDEIERAYGKVSEAYRVLSDPTQRSSYDQHLAQQRQQSALAATSSPTVSSTCPLYPEVFSTHTGCSVDEAKDFLAGRVPITVSLARKLQSEFGLPLEFWMSQPFLEDSTSPFAIMASSLLLIGLGYGWLVLVGKLF
jgi:hypothetical protein